MLKRHAIALLSALTVFGTAASVAQAEPTPSNVMQVAKEVGVPVPAVIAHRGASFYAPESTKASYLLARELGADYLELDLQRTKDGVLVAIHDNTLKRMTNVAGRFPERADAPVSDFTLAELKRLNAGSWFNHAFPDRARPSYAGLQILTLDEVIDIATKQGHTNALYIETKAPQQYPGIERDLKQKLMSRGLLDAKGQPTKTAAGMSRVMLQTFEKDSLEKLQAEMPNVPKLLLLWIGDGYMPARDEIPFDKQGKETHAQYYSRQEVRSHKDYLDWLDWAKAHGAIAVGPSVALKEGGEQSYADMVKPWMNQAAHERGLLIHPYTVDDRVDMQQVSAAGVEGMFTNRADVLLTFYERIPKASVATLLEQLGY